jgi:hypothetical protein
VLFVHFNAALPAHECAAAFCEAALDDVEAGPLFS